MTDDKPRSLLGEFLKGGLHSLTERMLHGMTDDELRVLSLRFESRSEAVHESVRRVEEAVAKRIDDEIERRKKAAT